MRWEDTRKLVEAINRMKYVPTEDEKFTLENAQRHIDQRRDMNKSAELPLHAIYRKAYQNWNQKGGMHETKR